MGIDRKAFFALALGIWAGPSVGCIVQQPPANTKTGPQTKDNTGNTADPNVNPTGECMQYNADGTCTTYQPIAEGGGEYGPGDCISWNATGECSQWGPSYEAGYGPVQECGGWDASGECNYYYDPYGEGGGYYPAEECSDWNASGECIQWMPAGEGYYPADECSDWNASGECIQWVPAGETY